VKHTAVLHLTFPSTAAAAHAAAALAADDDAHVRTHHEGALVRVEATAESVRGLLRAVDDVLANAAVSEDLLKGPPLDED
jgi:hypothetical protein